MTCELIYQTMQRWGTNFVLMKLGECVVVLWWQMGDCCQSHRKHIEQLISPLPEKKHMWGETGSAPSTKCSIQVVMNLHQPSGFAPAGDPVHFPSTCSSNLTDPPLWIQLGLHLSINPCLFGESSGSNTHLIKRRLIKKHECISVRESSCFLSVNWPQLYLPWYNICGWFYLSSRENHAEGSDNSKHICLETELAQRRLM